MRGLVLAACVALSGLAGCASLPQAPTFAETEALREQCPAERGVYTLPDSEAVLRIVKTPHAVNAFSDLALRADASGHTFWFSFVQSNGYGRMFLGYIADPTAPGAEDPLEIADAPGDNDLVLFDSHLRTLPIPQAGDPAPAYLVAPGIGPRFWYDARERISIPIGMWRRTGCAPA